VSVYNVAIIGAGKMGKTRAHAVQRSGNARVTAIADADFGRAQVLANEFGAEPITDWRQCARDPLHDLVVVSTPTKFHAEAAGLALRNRKHVLCEKPLARTTREAKELIEYAMASGRVLKAGFNYRYLDHIQQAKALLDANALGPLYFLRCRYGHGGRPGYENHWCTDLELSGGGVLLEQGIHIVDLVRYFLGEPMKALATTNRFFWNFPAVEDNCFLLLETSTGQQAQIHVSWTQWTNLFSLEIFGRNGSLELTGRDGHYGPPTLICSKRKPDHSRPEQEIVEYSGENKSWQREWADFINAIETGVQPMGNGEDGLRALEIVEAAYASSRQQKWVELSPSAELIESTR
jgi:predicted dehydrogenase